MKKPGGKSDRAYSGSFFDTEILRKIVRWAALHPNWALSLAALATLAPFLSKPFNMDDPLFLWAGRHIQLEPWNPYGFEVNWYGTVRPIWEVTKNPPLACYFIALAARIVGWSEIALHAAFLAPAVAAILATHRLAGHFCKQPALAAALTLLTPVFLVSSTTVMCDVLMLALWVWGVVLWVEGLDRGSVLCLTGAGVLVALAELAKYYAIALIPLLAMYALMKTRRIGKWSLALLIPILTLGIYHAATQRLYGKTLLSDAAAYAAIAPGFRAVISAKSGGLLSALTFMGGCLAICAFSAPLLFRRRALAWILVGTAIFAALLFSSGLFLKDYGPLHGTTRWFVEIQLIFWAMGGACLLALPVADIWARRNASSWLFGLWVGGTFIFAALLNWTVNGRSILPMAPAVAILLARRLDECPRMPGNFRDWGAWFALVLGGALALLVTRADFLFATTVRESARQTFAKYAQGNNRFWFQGHWGFQYYMEQLGVAAVDEGRTPLKRGDIVAEPVNNTNYTPFRPELVKLREMLAVRGERPLWLATMKGEVGAGFYAAIRGPLPFAWGDVPEELVAICALEPEIKFPSTSP